MTSTAKFRARKNQRGQTVVIFTMLCTLLLIPLAGLAIDASVVYLMKAKLSSAVDAAALATARSLNLTAAPNQQDPAITMGINYFAANLPAGTMGATIVGGGPTIPQPTLIAKTNTLQVNVTATVQVPLYFMRMLGYPTSTMTASGQASRRVSNIILVLDRSYSIALGGNCANLISSAKSFVNDFVDGTDTMGLVDFQASANEDFPAASNFKTASKNINSYIGQLQCTGYTNTADALATAYNRLQQIGQLSANNVIVLFTDGNADTISADFPVRTLNTSKTTVYNWLPIGSSNPSTVQQGASTCKSTIKTLSGVITNLPGGLTSANDVGGVYQDTAQAISWVSPYQSSGSGYPFPAAAVSGTNCYFTSTSTYSYPYNTLAIRNDVYIPLTDNSQYKVSLVNSYWTQSADYVSTGPYKNKGLRTDTTDSVNDAALSDADNMANMIRGGTASSGPAIQATIYTIGLGNPPAEVINTDFLERVANDARAPGYNSSQPTGLFILCNSSGLQSAFQQIASQILRLSK